MAVVSRCPADLSTERVAAPAHLSMVGETIPKLRSGAAAWGCQAVMAQDG